MAPDSAAKENSSRPIRFLHTADWQLGHWPSQIRNEERAKTLYEARFEAVRRIADLAHEHRVDFVLVAGDVFHHEAVGRDTLQRAIALLEAFAPIPVYLIPGNHDPVKAHIYQSRWFREARSSHVHVFLEPEVRLIGPDQSVALAAVPVRQKGETRPPLRRISGFPEAARYRIAMVHGDLIDRMSPDQVQGPPVTLEEARQLGLHYLALGHWHGWLQAERAVYPGTPEGTRFGETEPGHVALVTLHNPTQDPEIQKVPVGRYTWLTWSIEAETTHSALSELKTRMNSPNALTPTTLLRVQIQIRAHDPRKEPELQVLRTRLAQQVFHLDWHQTVLRRALPENFQEQVARKLPEGHHLLERLRKLQQEPDSVSLNFPQISWPDDFTGRLSPLPKEEVVAEALRELEQILLDLLEEQA